MKLTFQVLDMHCSNCAMKIEGLEDDLAGVKSINASYHKRQVVVEFDDQVLDIPSIVAAIKKVGYTAEPV